MSGEDCDGTHAPVPGERATLELGPAELFVVGALRAWVAPLRAPGGTHPDWREIFALAEVAGPGATAFDGMMSVVARSARRLLDVRCCRCPSLGEDEVALLALVGALQAGDAPGALAVLADWLPPASVMPALQGAQRFATLTAAAGLRLPVAGTAMVSVPMGATLH